jgi:putative phosphoribosyl transferase
MIFDSREDAGRRLGAAVAELFAAHPELDAPVVLALPRGGAPVALEVARALNAPLDLALARKIGVPWQPELAAAAVAEGAPPRLTVNEEVVALTGLSQKDLEAGKARALEEIARRRARWLGDRPRAPLAGRDLVVVDDGVATGATLRAALEALRAAGPRSMTLAAPVAAPDAWAALSRLADHAVCLSTPEPFGAIGAFYRDFRQLEDAEVSALLDAAPRPSA